jgi:hypothetical protein
MIRVDEQSQEADILIEPQNGHIRSLSDEPYHRPVENMVAISRKGTPLEQGADRTSVRIGAIDNSLSWPWKHPDAVKFPQTHLIYID